MRVVLPTLAVSALVAASGRGAAPPYPFAPGVTGARVEALLQEGKFAEAAAASREVVALRQRLFGAKHHRTTEAKLRQERVARLADLPEQARRQLGEAFRLTEVGEGHEKTSNYQQALEAFTKVLATCRGTLGEGHPETATAYNQVAVVLANQGKFAQAEPLYEKALAIRIKGLGEEHPDTAQSYANRGSNLDKLSKYDQALADHERGLAIRRKVLGESHLDTADSYTGLGYNLLRRGKYRDSLPHLEAALRITLEVLGEEHPDTARSYNNLAVNYLELGQRARARPLLEKSLAIQRKVRGEWHPLTAMAYNNLAGNLTTQGRYTEAEPLLERSLAINRKVFGEGHPNTAGSYNNIGYNLNAQGKYAQGQLLLTRALQLRKKLLGEHHPETAATSQNLAASLVFQGKFAEAQPLCDNALRITRTVLGEDHPVTATSYNDLAFNLYMQGKHAEAQTLYETALRIQTKTLGEKHPDTARSLDNLAVNLDAQRRHRQAKPHYERAYQIRREVLGDGHPETARSRMNLAYNLLRTEQHAEALPLLEQGLVANRKALGERHLQTLNNHHNLAHCLHALGRLSEAQRHLENLLAVKRQSLGDLHFSTTNGYSSLAGNLWQQGKHGEAVLQWHSALPGHELARLASNDTGFDRGLYLATRGISPRAALAAALAHFGQPRNAFRHAEADLSRGLLDEFAGASTATRLQGDVSYLRQLDDRLAPLVASAKLSADQEQNRADLLRQRRHLLADLTRRLGESSERQVLPLEQIQEQLPADAALVLWIDVLDQHHACVVRRDGPPVWQRLPGSGKGRLWTEQDSGLPARLYGAVVEPTAPGREGLLAALRDQRITPLRPHLQARGSLPAVRRLVVVPTGLMARVPVDLLVPDLLVSYTPSGSVFARLMARHRPLRGGPLLAVGDPVFTPATAKLPDPPAHGLLLNAVVPGGPAARAGLQSGDVLLWHGDQELRTLDDLRKAAASAGRVVYWREGKEMDTRLPAGQLGVALDARPAPEAIRRRREIDRLVARRGSGHEPLPASRYEVEAIARFVPGATTLTGSLASEQQLDRLNGAGWLSRFRILHFATHGEINWAQSNYSALVLAQDRLPPFDLGKKVYDGRLTVGTILREWQLDADLVVLSACETGLGKDAGGEGLLGFAQAFLQKGARSVVLSRWKVEDSATALLMLRFYENLLGTRAGLTTPLKRAEALAEAKRWLRALPRAKAGALVAGLTGGVLRSSEGEARTSKEIPKAQIPTGDHPYAHPFYWAAFTLLGDPD